jgi:hypothetical protein
MAFDIRMGQPEMDALWTDLSTRNLQGTLDKAEQRSFKKLVKALGFLAADPRHNSLSSHEIDDLSRKYGRKIFGSPPDLLTRRRGDTSGNGLGLGV